MHQRETVQYAHCLADGTDYIAEIPPRNKSPYGHNHQRDDTRHSNSEQHAYSKERPGARHNLLIPYRRHVSQYVPRLEKKRHSHYSDYKTDKVYSHDLVAPAVAVFPAELQSETLWEELAEFAMKPHEYVGQRTDRTNRRAIYSAYKKSGTQPE